MALTPGTRLGPYEILSALGAGGMGEVYEARDTRLSRTVAIKVLPADTATDAAARVRFEREARAIATLSHPHICVVHDVGHQDGTDYLVMELLDGETLGERLARAKGPLPLDEVLKIGTAIADALDGAHRAGIVHRDLKPANVMLTKSGPKLLDFGLAKLHGAASPVSLSDGTAATTAGPGTAKGTILGTIYYMSPEQVEGREADTRSDIWALGAVLYEMATGQRPFDGDSAASVVGAILKDTPPAVSARQPVSPPILDRIVQRSLTRDPESRYQSARDLGADLAWAREAGNSPAAAVSPTPRSRKSARWRAVGAVAVLTLLGVAIGVVWTWARAQPATYPPVWLSIAPPAGPFGPRLGPSVSPDGSAVAFLAPGADGATRFWVRRLSEPAPRPLPGTEASPETTGSRAPAWSPDGQSIAYFGQGKLQRIDVAGGTPITLADSGGAPRGISWGSRGQILFVPNSGGGMFTIPAAGGDAVALDIGELGRVAEWPSFLPDGRHLLFVPAPEQTPDETKIGVYLASVDSRDVVRISSVRSRMQYANGHVFYVQDHSLYGQRFSLDSFRPVGEAFRLAEGVGSMGGDQAGYAFSIADNGTVVFANSPFIPSSALRVLDRQGHASKALGDITAVFGLALSPDERRLIVETPPDQKNGSSLWAVDQISGVASLFLRNASLPVWSVRGDRLMYRTRTNGVSVTAIDNPAASVEVPLAGLPARPWPEDWSSDGRSMLIRVDVPSTQADLWVVAADGSQPPVPYLRTTANEYQARFSADGRWVAYTSDESGRSEVYVQSFPRPGIKGRASTAGGSRPTWRPDGRELYYIDPDGKFVAASFHALNTALEIGDAHALFDIPAIGSAAQYRTQVAAYKDGQHFLLNLVEPSNAPTSITVLLNWRPPTLER